MCMFEHFTNISNFQRRFDACHVLKKPNSILKMILMYLWLNMENWKSDIPC